MDYTIEVIEGMPLFQRLPIYWISLDTAMPPFNYSAEFRTADGLALIDRIEAAKLAGEPAKLKFFNHNTMETNILNIVEGKVRKIPEGDILSLVVLG